MKKRIKTGGRKKGTTNKVSQHGNDHLKNYSKTSMIYILKVNDRYKIGRTTNIEMRFKRCIGLCPYPIEIIHILETKDYEIIEKSLHKIYKNKRIHYEWFLLNEIDILNIKKIKSKDDLYYLEGLFNKNYEHTL